MLVLIAGSYRSGTGDDPSLMAANLARLEEAWPLFRAGVLRLPGESTGADRDVVIARERGLPVCTRLEDVPRIAAPALA